MVKVGLISLGCPKNRVDSEIMMGYLTQANYQLTSNAPEADVLVVNTCGFIESAKQESIDTILEMAHYKNEKCTTLVVTGCLSQRYKQELSSQLPEVDIILGTDEYQSLPELLNKRYKRVSDQCNREMRILSTPSHYAYLRIAEGCDNRCSFCAIPLIRGRYISIPFEKIIQEAKELAQKGIKELIIIAQDTTRYGLDLYGRHRLAELLKEIAALDVTWIRLLYAYPNDITDELLDVMATEPKIVKYIDIPLQHVEDKLLLRMNRRTNKKTLEELIRKIRTIHNKFIIRSTFIVGFPGETQEQFDSLCEFIQQHPLDRAGVFCYSPEDQTPAAKFPHQLSENIKQERAAILMQIQQKASRQLLKKRIGTIENVIIEGRDDSDKRMYYGRSYAEAPEVDGYIYIYSQQKLLTGELVYAKIIDASKHDLIAEIVESINE